MQCTNNSNVLQNSESSQIADLEEENSRLISENTVLKLTNAEQLSTIEDMEVMQVQHYSNSYQKMLTSLYLQVKYTTGRHTFRTLPIEERATSTSTGSSRAR